MEVRGDRVAKDVPAGTLVEFVAVRSAAQTLGGGIHRPMPRMHWNGPLSELRPSRVVRGLQSQAVQGRATCVPGLPACSTVGLDASLSCSKCRTFQWSALLGEIERFFQLRTPKGDASRVRAATITSARSMPLRSTRPASSRRRRTQVPSGVLHRYAGGIVSPSFRGDGAGVRDLRRFPGFYGIPMYFRGVADANFTTLCPIVVRPKHWVTEEVVYSLVEAHKQRSQTRRVLGKASHEVHQGTFTRVWCGPDRFAWESWRRFRSSLRVLFPRWTSRIINTMNAFVEPPPGHAIGHRT